MSEPSPVNIDKRKALKSFLEASESAKDTSIKPPKQ